MSINFDEDMNPEARELVKKLKPIAMDNRQALLNHMELIKQKEMKHIANAAKQPMTLEINKIGDRKIVGDIVYELRKEGWYRLPIGTKL